MADETKEQLEKELQLLTDSHEQGIISNDEFKNEKERIDKRIANLEKKEKEKEEKKDEPKPKEQKEVKKDTDNDLEVKELDRKELMAKEADKNIIKKAEEQKQGEEEKEKKEEKPKEEKKVEEKKETKKEEKKPEEKPKKDKPAVAKPAPKKKKKSKLWIFLIILLLLAGSYYYFKSPSEPEEKAFKPIFIEPECAKDSDCKQARMIGLCINPGTQQASCEFKQDVKVHLTILNDKTCNLCDSLSTLTILSQLFPNLEKENIDSSSSEGRELISQFKIKALPAFILDSSVSDAANYQKFSQALIENKDGYVVSPKASGSTYYFKETLQKNKLELIALSNDASTDKALENIQEFLQAFEGKIDFTQNTHPGKNLLEKFDITTFPTFIINNQIKVTGILPADMIKERFCKINKLEECKLELSKSLK